MFAVAAAQAVVNADNEANAAIANGLQATLNGVQCPGKVTILGTDVIGTRMVTEALQELAEMMLPNKIMQRVKH